MRGRGRSGGHNSGESSTLYAQLLLFPERAEYLNHPNYGAYRMQLDHWRELSAVFRRAFQRVYER